MFLYAALMRECLERGPDYMKLYLIFEHENLDLGELLVKFQHLRYAVIGSECRGYMIDFLSNCVSGIERPNQGWKILSALYSKVVNKEYFCSLEDEEPMERFPARFGYKYHSFRNAFYLQENATEKITITTINKDNGRQYTKTVYSDVDLEWHISHYVIMCNCLPIMCCPEVDPATKYFRVLYNGKTLFILAALARDHLVTSTLVAFRY